VKFNQEHQSRSRISRWYGSAARTEQLSIVDISALPIIVADFARHVAAESAHITLVQGDLRGIAKAPRLSRATMRNIRQNLFFALFCNVVGVPIAAGTPYPFSGILLSPIIASGG
jgi:cation transport ATPase